ADTLPSGAVRGPEGTGLHQEVLWGGAPRTRAPGTTAPWPYLGVRYRRTSGSLTALHASELTGPGRPRGAREAYFGWLSVRPGPPGGASPRACVLTPTSLPWSSTRSIAYPFRPSSRTTAAGNAILAACGRFVSRSRSIGTSLSGTERCWS